MDYGSNMQHYPTIQSHFRTAATPVLLLWGTRDQYLSNQAADAYKRDVQSLEVCLIDGGHWILESHGREVTDAVQSFLSKHLPSITRLAWAWTGRHWPRACSILLS